MRLLLLSFFNNFAKTSVLLHSRFHAPIITVTMKVLVFLTLKRTHIVARHAKQDLLEINVNGKVCMSIEANNLDKPSLIKWSSIASSFSVILVHIFTD